MPGTPPSDVIANLPSPLTPIVGREGEVAAVIDLLRRPDVRLLMLTGPGGVDKTRLALEAARRVASDFADGVTFVDLAPLTEPALVLHAVAQALGVREAGDRDLADLVAERLRDRRLLLVLDNFEHVVEAAPAATGLLAACADLTVLATSRVRLRVSGEREHVVPPLGLVERADAASTEEAARSEAVRLFVERAQAVKEGFALTDDNARAVAEVCRRLDGLPLAIELAAARVKVLPPPALLARLERRLPLLTGGGRDLPARQRTMRDAVAWSHDLLTEDEQRLFRRLAVFVGGCTLEAAEAVCAAEGDSAVGVLEGIASLVDKSLLRQDAGAGGEPRYRMLETVREFALGRLAASGEAEDARRRHTAWYLALVERAGGGAAGPQDAPLFERLAAEQGNLDAVLAWTLERGEIATGLRLIDPLVYYFAVRGPLGEGRRWMDRLLAAGADLPPPVRARALCAAGELAVYAGDYAAVVRLLGEGLALAREADDRPAVARALYSLALAAEDQGDVDRQVALSEEALALWRGLGDNAGVAATLLSLGGAARIRADYGRARALHEEALALNRARSDSGDVAWALTALAEVAADEGDRARAAALFREAARLHADAGHHFPIVYCLLGLAGLAATGGRAEEAARLLGAAEALWEPNDRLVPAKREPHARLVARVRAGLGEDAFAAAWAAGRALPLDQVVAEAAQLAADLAADPAGAATPAEEPSAAERAGLTAREVEVLRLLVAGRSDPQIAAALFLSPRTVQWHVANLLRKLGLPSRDAAAAHAARHGLV